MLCSRHFESSDILPVNVPYTLVNIKNCNNVDQLTFLRCPGIPELGYPEVEPILIDEINLALGAGPDGYRATFRNIEAFGVSNLTVTGVRWVQLTVNTQPNLTFQHYSHMLVNYNWVTILLICTMRYSFYNKTIKIQLRNHKLFSLLFSKFCFKPMNLTSVRLVDLAFETDQADGFNLIISIS